MTSDSSKTSVDLETNNDSQRVDLISRFIAFETDKGSAVVDKSRELSAESCISIGS